MLHRVMIIAYDMLFAIMDFGVLHLTKASACTRPAWIAADRACARGEALCAACGGAEPPGFAGTASPIPPAGG